MKKRVLKLNESDFSKLINECVKSILKEYYLKDENRYMCSGFEEETEHSAYQHFSSNSEDECIDWCRNNARRYPSYSWSVWDVSTTPHKCVYCCIKNSRNLLHDYNYADWFEILDNNKF